MCLIVYAPHGGMLERRVFDTARGINDDGIGVMSRLGVERYVGRKSGKRAWRAIRRCAEAGVPYGVHFRWATHGAVTVENCHPYLTPDGTTLVMHNGVLSATAKLACKEKSDTRVFVDRYLEHVPEPGLAIRRAWVRLIEEAIGDDNKFLMYHIESGEFTLAREWEGFWIDGFWYSNGYSLPWDMDPDKPASRTTASATVAIGTESERQHYRAALTGAGTTILLPSQEYADRNVRDAVTRESIVTAGYERDPYYQAVMRENGYYDDGAELGALAASRMLANGRCGVSGEMQTTGDDWQDDDDADDYADDEALLLQDMHDTDNTLSEEDKSWIRTYLADQRTRTRRA